MMFAGLLKFDQTALMCVMGADLLLSLAGGDLLHLFPAPLSLDLEKLQIRHSDGLLASL